MKTTTMMQTMKQSLVRPCCQRNAVTIRFVCWFMGVVSLLALGTYYLTRNMDDMVAGVDIDGFNERDAARVKGPTSDDDEDNDRDDEEKNLPAASKSFARSASNKVEDDWKNERKNDRDTDIDFEDNNGASRRNDHRRDGRVSDVGGRRSRRDEEADKNDVDANDVDYARQLRDQEADRARNARNAGDRKEQHGDGEAAVNYDDGLRRRRNAEDDNPVHNDVDGDEGDEAGKNKDKDGEENAGDAAVRKGQRGDGEDVADDDRRQRAADDNNEVQEDVGADKGDEAGRNKNKDAKNDELGEENPGDAAVWQDMSDYDRRQRAADDNNQVQEDVGAGKGDEAGKSKEKDVKNDEIGDENAADGVQRNGEGEDAANYDDGQRRRIPVVGGQGDEDGKDKEEDGHNDKIAKENAGDAADRNGDGEHTANDDDGHERGQAADDENQFHGDQGDKAGKDEENDAKNDEAGKNVDDDDANADEDENEGGNTAEDDAGKSYKTCDAECLTFRDELASWPADKPKAFIYYLIHRPVMRYLRKSIRALHHNFNSRFRYPIVVFVEPDLDNDVDRQRITDMVPTDSESSPPSIYVQVVRFQIPDYVNASLVPRMAGVGLRKRTIGYRHMCRFHAGGVYDQPIVRSPGLEYAWRLDHDSIIRSPIDYDLFQVMRDGRYLYGYRRINTGWSPVDYALWDEVDRYLNATPSLKPTFYRQWPKNAARYFNNFEVSALRVWMSPQYRDYFNFVDRLGGIYYHKWGDAAIKTIAVTLFIPRDRTHLFTGISYIH